MSRHSGLKNNTSTNNKAPKEYLIAIVLGRLKIAHNPTRSAIKIIF
jgi:hypothetical protein